MTVKELIAILQEIDIISGGDRQVIMSSDAEGNNYSPLSQIHIMAYRPTCSYSGEVGLEELTDKDREMGCEEEDVIVDGQPAIIFYPT